MAISLKTAGTWATLTADGAVTIPGSPAAGDRMFLYASWKSYDITAQVTGWTPIGSEFADGTTGAGNGSGSMKVMAWYRDWQSGDGDPTLDFSASPNVAGAVINLWQKGADEIWSDPLTVTAAWPASSSQTISADDSVAVPSGGVVMGLLGIRDDSATFTRPSAAIDTASGITWSGNHVESPATHLTTTTGGDMAADLGHRFVTTGGTVTLRMTATISASETGAAKWVIQGLERRSFTADAVLRKTQQQSFTADAVTQPAPPVPSLLMGGGLANGTSPQLVAFDGQTYGTLTGYDSTTDILAIAYGRGRWVLVTRNENVRSSDDFGRTWQSRTSLGANNAAASLVYDQAHSTWVVFGENAVTGVVFMATSTDLTTWTPRTHTFGTTSSASARRMAYGDGVLVAVGVNDSVQDHISVSTDGGASWTAASGPSAGVSPQAVAYGDGLWVMVANFGAVYTATDPAGTWTAQTSNFGNAGIRCVAYGNGLWVAAGVDNASGSIGPRLITSSNGTTWTYRNTPIGGNNQPLTVAIYYPQTGRWMLGRDGGGEIYVSTDGTTWSILSPAAFGSDLVLRAAALAAPMLTADAVIKREQSGSLTADAQLWKTQVGSFTANAVLTTGGGEVTSDFTADAVIRRTQVGSFTADTVLRRGREGAFAADAIVLAPVAGSIVADAVLHASIAGAFLADAWIVAAGSVTADFTADAVIQRSAAAALTADAILRRPVPGDITADAILRRSQVWQLTADAYFSQTLFGNLTADAILRGAGSGSFTARAFIVNDEIVPDPSGRAKVHIRADGVDITDDVVFRDAEFTMLVNGAVGSFRFRVRDTTRTRSFTTGAEITLDINGVRRFGGYLLMPKRMFAFDVVDTSSLPRVARFITLQGVDYNILLQKRVVYDKDNPPNVALRSWPADSDDDDVIKYVFDHYTDLALDGVTYDGVEHVGTPNPDRVGVVGSGGLTFADLMREINRLINGVWYIDPYKDLKFVDVDEPNASKSLSDRPDGGTEIGYREFGHTENGAGLVNDAMIWGAGTGSTRIAFGRERDQDSINAHGLWQFGEFTAQLYKQASVNKRASSLVLGSPQSKRGAKDDQVSWLASTFDQSFSVGEKVEIESEVWGVSDVVPIRRMTITFPVKTRPKFALTLSHEIDEPWNMFEFLFPKIGFDFRIPHIELPGPPVCSTTETFDRTFDYGFGVSEIDGFVWQPAGDPSLFSVTPGAAVYAGGASGQVSLPFPLGSIAIPAEVVYEVTIPGGTDEFVVGTMLDGDGTYQLNISRESGGTLALWAFVMHDTGGTEDEETLTGQLSGYEDQPIRIRMRVESLAVKIKVWLASSSEPGTWTFELEPSGTASVIDRALVVYGGATAGPATLGLFDFVEGYECGGRWIGVGMTVDHYVQNAAINHLGDAQWHTMSAGWRINFSESFGEDSLQVGVVPSHLRQSGAEHVEQREWIPLVASSAVVSCRLRYNANRSTGTTSLPTRIGLFAFSEPRLAMEPYAIVNEGTMIPVTGLGTIWLSPVGLAPRPSTDVGRAFWGNDDLSDSGLSDIPGYDAWVLTVISLTGASWVVGAVPTSGPVSETLAYVDGITYQLSSPYVPGSTQVWVDGSFVRPGIEYTESDPEAGQIEFSLSNAEDSIVHGVYEANGGF